MKAAAQSFAKKATQLSMEELAELQGKKVLAAMKAQYTFQTEDWKIEMGPEGYLSSIEQVNPKASLEDLMDLINLGKDRLDKIRTDIILNNGGVPVQ